MMTPEWLEQLYKASDVVFEIPAGYVCWPAHLYNPLTIGLFFPFLSSSPWQIRATPKMFYVARELRLQGIFCANYYWSVGNFGPCHKMWCGECYTFSERVKFRVRELAVGLGESKKDPLNQA
jgi:hypothetical protein